MQLGSDIPKKLTTGETEGLAAETQKQYIIQAAHHAMAERRSVMSHRTEVPDWLTLLQASKGSGLKRA